MSSQGPGPASANSPETKARLEKAKKALEIIQKLSEPDVRRYEQFRRSHLDRSLVKRCMLEAVQIHNGGDDPPRSQNITQTMTIAMAGVTKLFIGDLTARARKLSGNSQPLEPKHLREAYRQYLNEVHAQGKTIANGQYQKKPLFL